MLFKTSETQFRLCVAGERLIDILWVAFPAKSHKIDLVGQKQRKMGNNY